MNEIVVFDEVKVTIAEYKAENDRLVFDYEDPQGNKDARSHIASLRKVKTKVANIHKAEKAGALAYGRMLDSLKNEYTDEVDGMIKVHKDPLDAIEAEKQAKIDEDVRRHAEEEAKRQAEIEAKAKAYEEMVAKEAAEKAEAERIVREKQIAEEAAARATAEAEAKAKADAEAAAKAIAEAKALHKAQSEAAERAKDEEIQRVKAEAKLKAEAKEQARIKAEQKVKAEQEAKDVAEQARIANEEHRQEVELDIEKFLVNLGIGQENAIEILTALIEERIPHLTIIY